jgi:hypothetical protein
MVAKCNATLDEALDTLRYFVEKLDYDFPDAMKIVLLRFAQFSRQELVRAFGR